MGRFQLLQHLDQALGLGLLGEGVEGAHSVDVVEDGLAERLVLGPDPLQVQVGRDELVGGITLQRGLLEVRSWEGL